MYFLIIIYIQLMVALLKLLKCFHSYVNNLVCTDQIVPIIMYYVPDFRLFRDQLQQFQQFQTVEINVTH